MALATQCPHCGTMFRVASDQLKLRGGIVRCGACQEIFDGSATLVDLDQLPAKAPVIPVPSPASADTAPAQADAATGDTLPFSIVEADSVEDTPAAQPAPANLEAEDQPVYTLDFDHTFDPLGILPKVASPDDDSAAAAPETAPDAAQDTGLDEVAQAAPAAAAQPLSAPGSDVDALALVQPWSRVPAAPQDETAPAAVPEVSESAPVAQEIQAELPAPAPVEPAAAALPEPAAPPRHTAPSPDSIGRLEPAFGLPVDEELVAAPLPGHEPEPEPAAGSPRPSRPRAHDAPPLLARESAPSIVTPAAPSLPPSPRTPAAKRAEKAAARRSKLVPTKIESQPKLRAAEIDEPEFVKRSRHQEQAGRTRKIAMLAGSILLLLILVAQGAITFRNALAARFPGAKPALVSSCAVFGCRVELPAQVDELAIETGELTTLGGGVYSFTTALRNEANTAQAWPSLELALTDANDKPLVRRVFAPTDYLAGGTLPANGLAPGAEQPIKLHFRVADLKPSGYHIAVFYP